MENKKNVISLFLFALLICSCCKNTSSSASRESNLEYEEINKILYKKGNDYYFKYSYPNRIGEKISQSYGFENKILNLEDNSIHELKNIIQESSFKILKPPYYTDNNYIYIANNHAGTPNYSFFPIDSLTLRTTGSYVCDANNVYYYSKKIQNVNSKVFNSKVFNNTELPIELGFDDSSIYFQELKLEYSNFQELELNTKIKDSLQKIYFSDNK